ncbi:MAG: hypothetical protein ACR2OZ_20895 [Verrucomicrobiales bacterium]
MQFRCVILGSLVMACVALRAEREFVTDAMSDKELRAYRQEKLAELQRLTRETKPERTPEGTVHRGFFCTVYYTPKESGFTAERGFDVTPTVAPGLGGRSYARGFLQAVKMEGFGRLQEPVNGREYVQYVGKGRYQFARAPLGSRGNVLVARKSCAVSSRNPHLRQRMKLRIESPALREVFGEVEWEVSDTGGGIHPLQIDLYWGEDEPRGAIGRQRARPAGTRMEYDFDVVVTKK